jgi:hypothetical protein
MMLARRHFLQSLLLTSVAFGEARAAGQNAGSGIIECCAWMEPPVLKLGGRYKLTAIVRCVTGVCLVYAPLKFGTLGFLFEIKDTKNRIMDTPFASAPHPFVPKLPLNRTNFAELYSGMLMGASIEGNVSDLFPAAGKYSLLLKYLPPILAEEIPFSDTELRNEAIVRDGGAIEAAALNLMIASN